jgi:hypothetical protein
MAASTQRNSNARLQSTYASQVSVKEGIQSGALVGIQSWTQLILVFEVISAKEGRRLYQATSEHDLKVRLHVEYANIRCGYTQ